MQLTKRDKTFLLKLARKSITEALKQKTVNVQKAARIKFSKEPGVFVTLLRNGNLRGSMGYPEKTYGLIDAVVKAARDAAFKDPRFKPVRKAELAGIKLRVDILSRFIPTSIKGIKPGRHGIYLEYGLFKAVQLPEDGAKNNWTAREIVENTLRKAGLAPEMWKDKNVRIFKFTTNAFED